MRRTAPAGTPAPLTPRADLSFGGWRTAQREDSGVLAGMSESLQWCLTSVGKEEEGQHKATLRELFLEWNKNLCVDVQMYQCHMCVAHIAGM